VSHFFVSAKEGPWSVVPAATVSVASESVSSTESSLATVRGSDGTWVLVWRPGDVVRVSGVPLQGGIHVLRDRDEISVNGQKPMFFSTEKLPRIDVFVETGKPEHCPRCNSLIEPGMKIVSCPDCGVIHCLHFLHTKYSARWRLPVDTGGILKWSAAR
jgi:hypothetical protein